MHKNFAKTLFLGKNVIYLPECHSTNELAADLVNKQPLVEGTVIVTDCQTKGKGQRGNKWDAQPKKNLTCTLILRPSFLRITDQFYMTMVISMALSEMFESYLPHRRVNIKWPNDLYVDDQKCAGILIENGIKANKIDYMLVGIGVNINQEIFAAPNAASLMNFLGKESLISEVLEKILQRIEKYYLFLKNRGTNKLREGYLEKLWRKGEWHTFSDADGYFIGRVLGVDPIGRLVIERKEGQKCYHIKEVSFEK